ncbi:MAG: hypothetical protein LBC06_01125 [Rickettsiales bacterium]|jgi:hypothetical protein|nr:hypothetical protein [Rickettsiales bacterium]
MVNYKKIKEELLDVDRENLNELAKSVVSEYSSALSMLYLIEAVAIHSTMTYKRLPLDEDREAMKVLEGILSLIRNQTE